MKGYAPEETVYSKNEYQRGSKPMGFLKDEADIDEFSNELMKIQKKKKKILSEAQMHEIKNYDNLLQKIKFKDFTYTSQILQPGIPFYKFLAKKKSESNQNKLSLLKLWIPDTIVQEEGQDPFWIYSGFDGMVYRAEKFNDRSIVTKLGCQYQLNELSAIIKYQDFDEQGKPNGHQVHLLSTKELAIKIANKRSEAENMVTQRFIKCKGGNAFICRAHWRKNKAATCYIITNKLPFKDQDNSEYEKFVTNQTQRFACSIIESKGNTNYQEPLLMTQQISSFVQANTGVRFTDLVADYTKDESGVWWFLGVKAFALENPTAKFNFKQFSGISEYQSLPSSEDEVVDIQNVSFLIVCLILCQDNEKDAKDLFQKMRICKFCQLGFQLASLTHKLSMKQIINTEKYIKDIGFNKPWLSHSDANYVVDPFVLYQTFSVCRDCFRLHKQIIKLKQLHQEFAKVFGIQVRDTEIETGLPEDALTSDKMIDYIIEKHFSNPPLPPHLSSKDKKHETKTDVLTIPSLYRYKLLVILYDICEIDPIPKNYMHKDFNLEYTFMGKENKMKVNLSQYFASNMNVIPINKMQLFHFFVDEPQKSHKLIDNLQRLRIDFRIPSGKVVGGVNLNLNDFKSNLVNQKLYYQLVTFDKFIGYLRCALCWDAGQEAVDIKAIKLSMHDSINGIYIPPDDYCACDGLLDEWIGLIPNITEYNKNIEEKLVFNKTTASDDVTTDSGNDLLSTREQILYKKRSVQGISKNLEIKKRSQNFQKKQSEVVNNDQIRIRKLRPSTSTQGGFRTERWTNREMENNTTGIQNIRSIKNLKLNLNLGGNSNFQSQVQTSRTYLDRPTTAGTATSRSKKQLEKLQKQSILENLKNAQFSSRRTFSSTNSNTNPFKKISILSEKGLTQILNQKLMESIKKHQIDRKAIDFLIKIRLISLNVPEQIVTTSKNVCLSLEAFGQEFESFTFQLIPLSECYKLKRSFSFGFQNVSYERVKDYLKSQEIIIKLKFDQRRDHYEGNQNETNDDRDSLQIKIQHYKFRNSKILAYIDQQTQFQETVQFQNQHDQKVDGLKLLFAFQIQNLQNNEIESRFKKTTDDNPMIILDEIKYVNII